MSTQQPREAKSIAEYLERVLEIKEQWPNSDLAFRGHGDAKWRLESSAERRLDNPRNKGRIDDRSFIAYHEELLSKCRRNRYPRHEGKERFDLELTADLRHHKTATCLIDFTRSALVGLWFACEETEEQGSNGKVLIVNVVDKKTFRRITHDHIKEHSIRNILNFNTRTQEESETEASNTSMELDAKPSFWHWTPAHINERIAAQHSLFIFGLLSSRIPHTEEILITGNKRKIRKELKEIHDYDEESLFPDFVGFAYAHRHDVPYIIPDHEEYFLRGLAALQREDIDQAILDFSEAIQLKPKFAEAYYYRGRVYQYKCKFNRAIRDYDKAIKFKPGYAEAYCWRGGTYVDRKNRGDLDRAIQDYSEAIRLSPDYVSAYIGRGVAYVNKKNERDLKLASRDFNEARKLGSDYILIPCICGIVLLCEGKLDKAKKDLKAAKERGADIAQLFSEQFSSTSDFEQKCGIQLPDDIKEMLTPDAD